MLKDSKITKNVFKKITNCWSLKSRWKCICENAKSSWRWRWKQI